MEKDNYLDLTLKKGEKQNRVVVINDIEKQKKCYPNKNQLYIEPKSKKVKSYDYTIIMSLNDNLEQMKPELSLYIERPSDFISLTLKFSKKIKIKNVKAYDIENFADMLSTPIDASCIQIKTDSYGMISYTLMINLPSILHKYKIIWEWDE